jgi:hypothetical protein
MRRTHVEGGNTRRLPCKSGGCALKAVSLIAGGLLYVPESGTEGGVIHPDRAAEVSRGHSSSARSEGLNDEKE